ncbi:MAG: type I DNA topoisomerase [candidate division Zixibacteria bacterium]|nr:type I DNA topoisomerase [candidate division Zixibacteria bacterium]
MAKNLVIVESPAKSKTLAKFLSKDFEILSSVGHVVDLPKSKIGVDVKNNFEPQYEIIKGKEKIIAELRKAAKSATTVYLAPDPDREGEAIAWHLANSLKGKGVKASFLRVTFNEITKSAVTEAIKNPRDIDINLVNAQQARRVLDRLVGYSVSPFLWKTVARNLSAGRVQSVALRLICEREEEIKAFIQEEYWKISVQLATGKKQKFTAQLFKIDGKTVVGAGEAGPKKIVITTQAEADKIVAELKGQKYTVSDITKSERVRRPLPPFITSTLQQEAAKVYGFSPKQTMSVAQGLYEGIEIGQDGPTGLITYMRTDSTRVSDEALKNVRAMIGKEFGKEYLPEKAIQYSSKKNAQDAHEAVRPTYLDLSPEKVKKHLSPQQLKLYTLIWNRFIASQMNPAIFDVETVDITAGNYLFRASAQKIRFDGFLRIYHEGREADESVDEDDSQKLPDLKVDELLTLLKLDPVQSFTKPPARYSEAMLVKRMESDGIGRPSTYASIISTLKDRKYAELEQKRLRPTDLGTTVNKILVENFPDLFNVAFTASMEKELDLVEEGTDDWVKVLKDFYKPFIKTLNGLKGKEKDIKASMTEVTDIPCDKCAQPMIIKMGRNGRFLACSGYPECKSTKPLPEDEAKTHSDEKCEKCGSAMVIKTGRFGRFLACSGYPECKSTKPVTLGISCPKPGCGGKILEKQTKTKRLFYGCTSYPKCDFASWDKPINQPCPVCKHVYVLQKISKAKGDYFRCPECRHEMSEDTPVVKTVA